MQNKQPSRQHKERDRAMERVQETSRATQGFYVELPYAHYKKLKMHLLDNDNQPMSEWLKEQIEHIGL